jgi:DNA-binding protein H-NS
MRDYGLSLTDMQGSVKELSKQSSRLVEVKYRDEATGDTWTGRCRAPKWLLGKNKNKYLIKYSMVLRTI